MTTHRSVVTKSRDATGLIDISAFWLKTRAVAAHAARVNVRGGPAPAGRVGRVDESAGWTTTRATLPRRSNADADAFRQ